MQKYYTLKDEIEKDTHDLPKKKFKAEEPSRFQIDTVKEDTTSKDGSSHANKPPLRPKTSKGQVIRPFSSFRRNSAE